MVISSELKTICEERNKKVTYVLQSTNNIIAYRAEFYQISQSLVSESFSKHSSNWKIIDMRQCNIGDKNLTISNVKTDTNLSKNKSNEIFYVKNIQNLRSYIRKIID